MFVPATDIGQAIVSLGLMSRDEISNAGTLSRA